MMILKLSGKAEEVFNYLGELVKKYGNKPVMDFALGMLAPYETTYQEWYKYLWERRN